MRVWSVQITTRALCLHFGQHLGVEHVGHILHIHLYGGQQPLGRLDLIRREGS